MRACVCVCACVHVLLQVTKITCTIFSPYQYSTLDMRRILSTVLACLVSSYQLLDFYKPPTFTQLDLVPCTQQTAQILQSTADQVASSVSDIGLFKVVSVSGTAYETRTTRDTITNETTVDDIISDIENEHGVAIYCLRRGERSSTRFLADGSMRITLNSNLLKTYNTLQNVWLHEVFHTLGVGHSFQPGIMNYTVLVDKNTFEFVESSHVFWASPDDYFGLRHSYALRVCHRKKRCVRRWLRSMQ